MPHALFTLTRRPHARLGVACLGLAALLAAAFPARPALATKEYAKAEGKDCSFCHIDSEGGGPRGERGRLYEANGHRFGVESWSSDQNRADYLRARSALMATWYGECDRLLAAIAKRETLPGGTTLIKETRKRYDMFPRTWLRSAQKLLEKGARGRPNAVRFLARLESQFGATNEGREAAKMLDGMAADTADPAAKVDVHAARADERVRLRFLEARTEYQLGALARARELFEAVRADPQAESLREDVDEFMGALADAEKAAAAASNE